MKPAAQLWILAGLAWLYGLGVLQACERPPERTEWSLLLGMLAACALLLRTLRGWFLPLTFLLAFTQGAGRAQRRLDQALPWAWKGRDVGLIGRVDSLPARRSGRWQPHGAGPTS